MRGHNHDAHAPQSGTNERNLCEICKEFNIVSKKRLPYLIVLLQRC